MAHRRRAHDEPRKPTRDFRVAPWGGASQEVVMRSSIGAGLLTVTLALGLSSAATPSRAAVSADLAKKCRAMMVEAHPSQFYGATGTAAAQRDYFKQCIS